MLERLEWVIYECPCDPNSETGYKLVHYPENGLAEVFYISDGEYVGLKSVRKSKAGIEYFYECCKNVANNHKKENDDMSDDTKQTFSVEIDEEGDHWLFAREAGVNDCISLSQEDYDLIDYMGENSEIGQMIAKRIYNKRSATGHKWYIVDNTRYTSAGVYLICRDTESRHINAYTYYLLEKLNEEAFDGACSIVWELLTTETIENSNSCTESEKKLAKLDKNSCDIDWWNRFEKIMKDHPDKNVSFSMYSDSINIRVEVPDRTINNNFIEKKVTDEN